MWRGYADDKVKQRLIQQSRGITLRQTIRSLFVLRFYGPVNPMGSCRAWSVYLTTRFLGRLSPLSGSPVLCTFFCQKLTTALLESAEGREWLKMTRKYFTINLHERMLPTSAGVEPATSWSPVGRRIQRSHRGRPTIRSGQFSNSFEISSMSTLSASFRKI